MSADQLPHILEGELAVPVTLGAFAADTWQKAQDVTSSIDNKCIMNLRFEKPLDYVPSVSSVNRFSYPCCLLAIILGSLLKCGCCGHKKGISL